MVETFPYEALSHAALAWLEANLARCDVVHVHEWGGVFVDVITAAAYRQLKPGEARVQVYRGCLLPLCAGAPRLLLLSCVHATRFAFEAVKSFMALLGYLLMVASDAAGTAA